MPTGTWAGRVLPPIRWESHFGDRVVRCFSERPSSIDGMFREAVARHGCREAIVQDSGHLSYAELAAAVDIAASGLESAGIGCGDRVAMLIGNRPEFVVVLLALQRLRAIAVPISIREQAPGVAYVLGHSGARLLIHDDDLAGRLPAAGATAAAYLGLGSPAWEQLQKVAPRASEENESMSPSGEEDTAVILYTSGTTGLPKGAMLSHFNIIHSALHYEFCMDLGYEDRSAVAVPLSHVTGLVGMVMAMLRVGGALVIVRSFKAGAFLQLAAAQRITHTILVPAMYQLCLLEPDFDRYDLRAWRIGAYGGAPMPRAAIEALRRRLPAMTLMNAYGATETTSPATIMPAGQQADHLTSVGQPVPAADIKVMDDLGQEVPMGSSGELWIAGPMVVAGYWDDPQATATAFTGGYWKSGDIGSVDDDGFVAVFDRRKDMLNRGGYKIYSVEVENVLLGYAGVVEAAVVGRPCPVLGERVHAVVCVAPSLAEDPAACELLLRAHCLAALADYKVPETWIIRTEPLPRNANGKLMKRDLRPV